MKEVITSDQEWEKNPFFWFSGGLLQKRVKHHGFWVHCGGGADDRPAGRLCCGRRNSPAWDKRAINQWTDRRRGRSVFQSSGPDKPMLLIFVVYLTARYGTPTFCSTFFFFLHRDRKKVIFVIDCYVLQNFSATQSLDRQCWWSSKKKKIKTTGPSFFSPSTTLDDTRKQQNIYRRAWRAAGKKRSWMLR